MSALRDIMAVGGMAVIVYALWSVSGTLGLLTLGVVLILPKISDAARRLKRGKHPG